MPHTSTNKGKRVKIVMRDGSSIIDKFIERKKDSIILKESGKIYKKDIKAFIIYKQQT